MLETTGMIKVEKLYYNIIRKTKFSCGNFQWMMFGIILTGMNGFSFINLGLAFYELMPTFKCELNGTLQVCSTADIC